MKATACATAALTYLSRLAESDCDTLDLIERDLIARAVVPQADYPPNPPLPLSARLYS